MRQAEKAETVGAANTAALGAARALARKFAESDAYKEFEAASKAFQDDAEAQKLFRSYQNAQRETQMIRGWGGRDQGFEDRFQQLQAALFAHPSCKRYLESQEEMMSAVKELNAYLTERLGFDFADMAKPAGGCC